MTAQITGEITASFEGREYRLMLGLRGIARLQEEYGKELTPLMEMSEGNSIPDMNVLLRVVDIALMRHHDDVGEDVAEGLLMQDMDLPGKLLAAAFPTVEDAGGNGKGKRRAGR
ncbi:hypothetical protein [Paracoccus siganidrum]|uniref:Phage tail assembly protein n=1 Tax=Paracoccus siganidrum TaxID=1276757 RepID=A0A419A608_9RHOB|nr:hypothetical protein [Paracoccus siganidrum]RJL13690.1 hypothetical protein D3P05_11825 [Paracoccus siganidrum]RMC33431.1 hypothetical protein C9E82_13355 [Paracoccus siganidrum]